MPLGVFNSSAFTNASGLAVAAGAAIEVRRESDSALADIFEDRDGNTGISQPGFVSDSNGRFTFYAAGSPGGYSVEVDDGVNSFTLRNVPIGTAQELDASDFGATIMDAADAAAARTLLDVYSEAEVDAFIPGSATTDDEGLVELATQAEMDAGTAGKVPTTDMNKITLGTPQAATGSETAFNFTVPAGTREVTVIAAGLSLSGTDNILVQIGPSAGVETTGYVSTSMNGTTAPSIGIVSSTAGFIINAGDAARIFSGRMVLNLLDSATNLWVSGVQGKLSTASACVGGGDKAIAGELVNVRVTRTGTDTFDAGSVNIASAR